MLYKPSRKQLISLDISLKNLRFVNDILQSFLNGLNENIISLQEKKKFFWENSICSQNHYSVYGLSKSICYLSAPVSSLYLYREKYVVSFKHLMVYFLTTYIRLRLVLFKTNGIFFPAKKKLFTILRSPHTDKKSREQFYLILHKFLLNYFYYKKSISLFLGMNAFLFKNPITIKETN